MTDVPDAVHDIEERVRRVGGFICSRCHCVGLPGDLCVGHEQRPTGSAFFVICQGCVNEMNR